MIKIFYSKSSKGFFQSDVNKNIPSDAVEITSTYKQQLLDGEAEGKVIVADETGYPVLQDMVFSTEQLAAIERAWRNAELARADIELYKVQDSDPKAKGAVGDWRTYRKALRMLPEHPDFPSQTARPIAPDAT